MSLLHCRPRLGRQQMSLQVQTPVKTAYSNERPPKQVRQARVISGDLLKEVSTPFQTTTSNTGLHRLREEVRSQQTLVGSTYRIQAVLGLGGWTRQLQS